MRKKTGEIVVGEIIRLALILLLGALFIIDTSGKNFSYPLAMRPEWKDRFEVLGWIIVYAGYPVSASIRLFQWARKQKNEIC